MEVDPAVLRTLLHETTSALGAVWSYVDALYAVGPAPDAEAQHYHAVMSQRIGTTLDIVNDFHSRVILETAPLEVRLAPVDLAQTLLDLQEEVVTEYEGWSLEWVYAGALPSVLADAQRLSLLLKLMAHDAVRCSASAAQKIVMEIQVHPEERTLAVAAWDAVPPIPPEYLSLVFDPMAQLPQDVGWPKWGLGLKLFPGRLWARGMGGDLHLELVSQGQPATRLVLTLPLA